MVRERYSCPGKEARHRNRRSRRRRVILVSV
jgi:hypothetical protein